MRVGVQMIFQSWGYDQTLSDGDVVAEEIRLGELADELGFHALWPVEHHFDDYSFCPDNTVFLAHMAARTKRILLGTGAVILPWNDPLRVAEKIALLDHLSDGRVLFGMGRGLARCEYAGFGIPMDESRDRFDESARMILDALDSDHFKTAKGYESYGSAVELMRAVGLEKLCEMYLGVNVWGTPAQIIERLQARREVIGDHDLTCCFRFAGLPYDDAEASMR